MIAAVIIVAAKILTDDVARNTHQLVTFSGEKADCRNVTRFLNICRKKPIKIGWVTRF